LWTGLPDIFRSLWPKWLFFEKDTAKNAKCFYYGILYDHRELKMYEGIIFLPKRSGLAKAASFDPKTAILS